MRLLIAFLLFYAMLIVFHGYTFGDNDHIELMSYVKWLNNPALYPDDFFVQRISCRVPNERIITASVLCTGIAGLEWWTFFLHASATISLLFGLYKIAGLFLQQEWKIWLFLVLLFFPFYFFNLGGNDIYYNSLSASNLSKALGVWTIYFTLKDKFFSAVLFAIPATFFHPLAGFQVFILCFGARSFVFFEKSIWRKTLSEEIILLRKYALSVGLFLVSAGFWLYLLFSHFKSGTVSEALFYEIIHFRLPHHFIPSFFGIKNFLLFTILLSVGLYSFYRINRSLFYFFVIALAGMLLYTMSVELMHSTLLMPTQWFKTSIWIKPLGLMALLYLFFSKWNSDNRFIQTIEKIRPLTILLVLLGGLLAFKAISNQYLSAKPYHLPFVHYENPEMQIAEMAKQLTPKDAVFLTPASATAFKYYSERSSYIDFKAVTHSKSDLQEWYQRIQDVYRIDGKGQVYGLNLTGIADSNFNHLNEVNLLRFKKAGVTHVLLAGNPHLNFSIVAQNAAFTIYQLPQIFLPE